MDGNRFDDLARTLAGIRTRRGVLRGRGWRGQDRRARRCRYRVVVRLIAPNTTIPRFRTSGFEALNTVWPHCPDTGVSQVLNPSEISQPSGGCGHVFYDEEFTVVFALYSKLQK